MTEIHMRVHHKQWMFEYVRQRTCEQTVVQSRPFVTRDNQKGRYAHVLTSTILSMYLLENHRKKTGKTLVLFLTNNYGDNKYKLGVAKLDPKSNHQVE